jgi:hypothetical protein
MPNYANCQRRELPNSAKSQERQVRDGSCAASDRPTRAFGICVVGGLALLAMSRC